MKSLRDFIFESLTPNEVFNEIQSLFDLGEDSSDIIKSWIKYVNPKEVEFTVCKQQVEGKKSYEDAIKDITSKVNVINGEDKFNNTVKNCFGDVPQFFNMKGDYLYGGYEGNYYTLVKKIK